MSRVCDVLLFGACFLVLALAPRYVQAGALLLAALLVLEQLRPRRRR